MSGCARYDHVIIGNSAAAVSAVEAIRKAGDSGSIAMIGEEPYSVYARHLISYYLTGQRTLDFMRFRPKSFYSTHGVSDILGVRAIGVDWDQRTVHLSNGNAVAYGDLLLAVGAQPVVPQLPGKDLANVFTFTSLSSAETLREALPRLRSVVVIGGGLIGLQVAEALAHLEKNVTVIELQPRLLAPVLDQTVSEMVADRVRAHGLHLRIGMAAQALLPTPERPRQVGAVQLANGERIYTDAVILAIGVAPRLELVQDSSIETDRAILVDPHMSTTLPGVYAAGDVAAEVELTTGKRRSVPVWPNAMRQGRLAGLAMAGVCQESSGSLMMNAAHFFGLPVVSAGMHDPAPESGYVVVADGPNEQGDYRKLVLHGERVVGMVAAGTAIDRAGIIYGLIRSGEKVDAATACRLTSRCDLLSLPTDYRLSRLAGRLSTAG